jgi:hypothetical protein
MFVHDFNVYETLSKLDGLLESGHDDDPSPMDRAEYKVLTSTLVRGAVELLGHLALHDVLALETAEELEPVDHRQVSTKATDSDGGFTDEVVTITLPAHLVPYGAIVESMKTWNVGTIETLADLCVLARLWDRYLKSNVGSNEETAILAEWQQRAERVGQGCLPALQQLDAAGILGIKDLRTDKWYRPEVVRHDGTLEICIATEAELARSSAAKKTPSRKRSVQKRARKTR